MSYFKLLLSFNLSILLLTLSACGGGGGGNNNTGDSGPLTYSIGGSVSGLSGSGLVLQVNAGNDLNINANGLFTFSTSLNDAANYNVSILTQPTSPEQECILSNASGTVSASNITNINVVCTTPSPPPVAVYSIGGSVSGLSGTGLVLQNNLGDDLVISANGSFNFSTALANAENYSVSVSTQASGQVCSVTNATGTVSGANITDISVSCVSTPFTVGGNVSGLTGSGLVLQNNSGDDLAISADGSFSFLSTLFNGETYNVTVLSQPNTPTQSCTVINGTGSIAASNVSNVSVVCSNIYNIGFSVNGKDPASTDLILLNQGEPLPVSADGSYAFATPLASGENYNVTVMKNPGLLNQSCVVSNGSGTVVDADINNISVSCSTNVMQATYAEANGWNDYVKTISLVTACVASSANNTCKHGGEMRTVDSGIASCTGLIASDALNVFNWVCDDSSGSAVFSSTSLKETRRLSDLIDFSNIAWKTNQLIVSGSASYSSPMEVWWPNAIVESNFGGDLADLGTIYVVTQDTTADYTISSQKVALVIQPGNTLTASGANFSAIDASASFLWLEGNINANGAGRGISLGGSLGVLRGVTVSSAVNAAINLFSTNYNKLSDVIASDSIVGIRLNSSDFNTLYNVRLNSNSSGLYIFSSKHNTITNSTAINNIHGFRVDIANGNMLSYITAANNTYGVYYEGASTNTLHDAVLHNNQYGFYGLDQQFNLSENNLSYNLAASYNDYGIYWDVLNANQFERLIKVGNNSLADCYVVNDTGDNGLIDDSSQLETTHEGLCLPSTSSGFVSAVTGLDSSASMIGRITLDDVANTSDTNGYALHADITDWGQFDNAFRLWGREGTSFSSADSRLTCNSVFPCRIMDTSLSSSDTQLHTVNAAITNGNAANTQYYTRDGIVGSDYLLNSVERFHDGIGDEDGVCETNEACIITPNLGSYQGHGALQSGAAFTDGDTLTGITLWQYSVNGN